MTFKAERIILHCSASANGKPVDISEVEKWHLARGFSKVGYHIVINTTGEAQRGRFLNEAGAHCEGENHNSIGICMIGTNKFTKQQWDSLRSQIDSIRISLNIPASKIYGHYQMPSAIKQGKTCPCFEIGEFYSWYLASDYKAIDKYTLKEVL